MFWNQLIFHHHQRKKGIFSSYQATFEWTLVRTSQRVRDRSHLIVLEGYWKSIFDLPKDVCTSSSLSYSTVFMRNLFSSSADKSAQYWCLRYLNLTLLSCSLCVQLPLIANLLSNCHNYTLECSSILQPWETCCYSVFDRHLAAVTKLMDFQKAKKKGLWSQRRITVVESYPRVC